MQKDEGLNFIRIIGNWVLPSLMAALVISGFVTFEDLKIKSISYGQQLTTLVQSVDQLGSRIDKNYEINIKGLQSQINDIRERLVKLER